MEWKNGGMEEWRNGGMEEWRNGGMEEWWNGGMVGWQNILRHRKTESPKTLDAWLCKTKVSQMELQIL